MSAIHILSCPTLAVPTILLNHPLPGRKQGFLRFIDSILKLPDVYFVTSQELIAWTRFPEPLPNVS